jgi:acetyl esterase
VNLADDELAEFVERVNDGGSGEFDVAAMRAGGVERARTRPAGPDPAALPALQVLLCANTDLTGSSRSMRDKASGWGLMLRRSGSSTPNGCPTARDGRTRPSAPCMPRISMACHPALVITAEHDPLRDEGEQYAERLRAAGVPVRARREPGLIHGFVTLDWVSPACAAALQRVIEDVEELLDCG